MSEHTPGPWTYKTRGLLNGSSWPKHSLIVGPEAIVLNGIPYYHPDDAAILAAAPDLLEACENFVFEFADLGEQLDATVGRLREETGRCCTTRRPFHSATRSFGC